MKQLARFGPAGNSDSFEKQFPRGTNLDVPAYLNKFKLDWFEYQAGRGVHIKQEPAAQFGEAAKEGGIGLSIHAPYFISLSSEDEQKRHNSARYLLESAAAITAMGGRRIVLHSGSAGKMPREAALALAKTTLSYCIERLDAEGYKDVVLCPEVMGKLGQLGTLEEVMELCSLDERLLPCVDFGHLNARTHGGIKKKADYAAALDTIENALGHERMRHMHVHFSKIEYSDGGEKRHLTFSDQTFGPDPLPLLELFAEREMAPVVVCESRGTQAEDAAWMKKRYMKFV